MLHMVVIMVHVLLAVPTCPQNAIVLGLYLLAWYLLGPYHGGMFRIPLTLVFVVVFIFMTLDYSED